MILRGSSNPDDSMILWPTPSCPPQRAAGGRVQSSRSREDRGLCRPGRSGRTQVWLTGEGQEPAVGHFQDEIFLPPQIHLGVTRSAVIPVLWATERPPPLVGGLHVVIYQSWPQSSREPRRPDQPPSLPALV